MCLDWLSSMGQGRPPWSSYPPKIWSKNDRKICITIDFEKVPGRKRYTLKCFEFWGWTIGVHQGFSPKVSSYPSRTLALVSELSVTPSGNHIFYETLNIKHLQLSFYISYTLIHFKCHYGFSKNDFSRKFDQWWARQKKFSESDMSFASNSLLKSDAFGSRLCRQKPGNEWRQRRNHTKWPKSFSVVYMQELSKPRAQCKLFKSYPISFILLQTV